MSDKKSESTGYYFDIIRDWYQFQMEEQPKPIHAALFMFIVEKFNSLWWPSEIGLPTDFTMRATSIGSYNTYKKTLLDLESFGFLNIVNKGKNQYTATRIALSFFDKAYDKARDKAKYKALTKHVTKQLSDNKQLNIETIKQLNTLKKEKGELEKKIELLELENKKLKAEKKAPKIPLAEIKNTCLTFDQFWAMYDLKQGKEAAINKFKLTTEADREKIIKHVPEYKASVSSKQFLKRPAAYLNQKAWNDEVVISEHVATQGYAPRKTQAEKVAQTKQNAMEGISQMFANVGKTTEERVKESGCPFGQDGV